MKTNKKESFSSLKIFLAQDFLSLICSSRPLVNVKMILCFLLSCSILSISNLIPVLREEQNLLINKQSNIFWSARGEWFSSNLFITSL